MPLEMEHLCASVVQAARDAHGQQNGKINPKDACFVLYVAALSGQFKMWVWMSSFVIGQRSTAVVNYCAPRAVLKGGFGAPSSDHLERKNGFRTAVKVSIVTGVCMRVLLATLTMRLQTSLVRGHSIFHCLLHGKGMFGEI
jgi:hypothetical protein